MEKEFRILIDGTSTDLISLAKSLALMMPVSGQFKIESAIKLDSRKELWNLMLSEQGFSLRNRPITFTIYQLDPESEISQRLINHDIEFWKHEIEGVTYLEFNLEIKDYNEGQIVDLFHYYLKLNPKSIQAYLGA